MSITVPVFYKGKRVSIDDLDKQTTWREMDPEVKRRFRAMFLAAGGKVGIGGGFRDPIANDAEVKRRHAKGIRNMQFSDKTYHCIGYAADLVGDTSWAKANCERFGLWNLPSEAWHYQPLEVPHGRPRGQKPSLRTWKLDGVKAPAPDPDEDPADAKGLPPFDPESAGYSMWPAKDPKPRLQSGSVGDAVRYLQSVVNNECQLACTADGIFGPQTDEQVRAVQGWNKLTQDGWVGPDTWAAIDAYTRS